MSKVYDNGVIREEPYWWLEGFSKVIMLINEFDDNMIGPYDNIYFRTEEDTHKYASEHGLKENEYCVAICRV